MPTDRRHRLLFLLPFPPRAEGRHGGARAMAEVLRRIARRHAVALLYLRDDSPAPFDAELEQLCEHVVGIDQPLRERGSLGRRVFDRGRMLAAVARGVPIWVQAVDVPEFAAAVRQAVRDWEPDLVELDYHVMGRYLGALEDCPAPRVLSLYEPGEDAAGRAWENPSRLLLRWDRHAWSTFERRILRQVQCVVALTRADALSVERRGVDVPIETIPLGVPVPGDAASPVGQPPPTVLFVGNFRHVPNEQAALRLVHDIWPDVRSRHADAVLQLVGEHPPVGVAGAAGVEVTGGVDEVGPYLDRAAVCVAPLQHGGGMRVKVLEALAAGKALVASPLAVAGLDVEHERHVLLAVDDREFASAISRLLRDPSLRESLAVAARAWALDNVSLDRTAAAFESLYDRLIEGRA